MINNFNEIFILLRYPLIGLFSCLTILTFFWMAIFKALNLKEYNNIQRVHTNEVSRLGGLFIYFFFWIILLFDIFDNDLFLNILVSSLPFIIFAVKEDIFHNTSQLVRLSSMAVSCFIFFFINPYQFPKIDIYYLGDLINYYPISLVFFSFTVLVLMNGHNFIDGINGLFGFTALFQLFSIIILASAHNDLDVVHLCIVFALPLMTYLLFNFPFGKLFAGDTGAYFYGYSNAIICIYFFGKNDGLLSWLAVLIMFYPCLELLFSLIRKLINKSSPFDPDKRHLHTILFIFLKKKFKVYLASILCIFIMFPIFGFSFLIFLVFTDFIFFDLKTVFLFIFLITFFYLILYRMLNNIINGYEL